MTSNNFDLNMLQWSLNLLKLHTYGICFWLLSQGSDVLCQVLILEGSLNSQLRTGMRRSLQTRHSLSVDGVRAIKPDAFCQLSHTQQWVSGVR